MALSPYAGKPAPKELLKNILIFGVRVKIGILGFEFLL